MTRLATTSAHRATQVVLAALMLWPINESTACCCILAAVGNLTSVTCQHSCDCDCCCSRSEQQRSSPCCVNRDNAVSSQCSAECRGDCDCELFASTPRLFDSRRVMDELQRQDGPAHIACDMAVTPTATLTDVCRDVLTTRASISHSLRQAMLCVWLN